jgi:Zn-finger nucleic acid-binding protein
MPNDQPLCPGCGSPMNRVADRGVRNQCPGCGGLLFGLSPFERRLKEGVGARVWVASSQSGLPGPACPFCNQSMRQPAADGQAPAGLAMCHTCEQVWVPASATEWMNANAAPDAAPFPASAAAPPAQCSNCGAPFQPDDSGRCHFCHAQLAAPPEPVFIEMTPPYSQPRTGSRLLDALAGFLTDPIQ